MALRHKFGRMNKSILLCIVALCGLGNAQLLMHSSQIPQPAISKDLLRQLSNGTETFALELFRLTAEATASAQRDCIISPFSIWSLMVLLAEGSKGNTYQELKDTLGLPENIEYLRNTYRAIRQALNVNTSTIQLSTSQVLFTDINRPVNPDYESTIESGYKAELIPVNLHDPQLAFFEINNYVSNATNGRIRKIVQVDDLKDAQLMLISAITFRGSWKIPFNKSQTESEPFFDEFGLAVGNVNMMYQSGVFPYALIPELNAHAVELPYGKEDRLSMVVILPKKDQSLLSVIANMGNVGMSRIFSTLKKAMVDYEDEEVEVYLPKFTITSDFTLNSILEDMGIRSAFDSRTADFSLMSRHPLYLSRVMHKAKIEVDEEGTVASAATGGSFANKSTPPRFYANRPFMYLIIEKITNTVIFCGQVRNPKSFKF